MEVLKVSKISIRTVTGTSGRPQLYLTKELRELNLKAGDHVAVMVEDNKIIIQKAKIKVED
ncbi:MAG: hypothetical protein J7J61_07090 [Candidatus Hydrothermae bacterium]|nr:hypothetical protein [Candidatus Hydrothermae bacterium]